MRKLKVSVMFAFVLGGCTSLQVVTLGPGTIYTPAPYQPPINPPLDVAVRKQIPEYEQHPVVVPKETRPDIYVCPVYTFRKTAAIPPLTISDSDDAKRALMKYVDQLRSHINTLNEQKASDERKYLAACKRYHAPDK